MVLELQRAVLSRVLTSGDEGLLDELGLPLFHVELHHCRLDGDLHHILDGGHPPERGSTCIVGAVATPSTYIACDAGVSFSEQCSTCITSTHGIKMREGR